jgi:hypothetical protein
MERTVDLLGFLSRHPRRDAERLIAFTRSISPAWYGVICGVVLIVAGAASQTQLVFAFPGDSEIVLSARTVGSIGLGLFIVGGAVTLARRITRSRSG